MARQVVLFGGSFDPVHCGHLAIARAIAERCRFERITLVPAAAAPHKGPAMASAEDRLAMLRLAVADDPLLGISEVEVHRSGPSYTIDTLEAVLAAEDGPVDLFLIVGSDMLADMPSWRRADDVVRLATIVTAARAPWHADMTKTLAILTERFGTAAAERLRRWAIETPLIDVSSTAVRQAAAAGETLEGLVPQEVAKYIRRKGLYGRSKAR